MLGYQKSRFLSCSNICTVVLFSCHVSSKRRVERTEVIKVAEKLLNYSGKICYLLKNLPQVKVVLRSISSYVTKNNLGK